MSATTPKPPSSSKRRWKPLVFAVLAVLVAVAAIGGVKALQIGAMIEAGESFKPPAIGVTTSAVSEQVWEVTTGAIGTSVATQEIMVASEVPGKVEGIKFKSGEAVKKGQVLVVLDAKIERAQLAAGRATAKLAKIGFDRTKSLFDGAAVAQVELDSATSQRDQSAANVSALQATIAKKTIRAPFAGKLGIRAINLGEVLQPGTPIVSLQAINPIYIDFKVPERAASKLSAGMKVRATSEALAEPAEGTIETIDGRVEAATRNVRVRAVFENPEETIRPGMFLNIEVVRSNDMKVLAVPNAAVLYAPYGDSVYVVNDKPRKSEGPGEAKGGEAQAKVAEQVFVRLGERRGDLVEVASGLEAGQEVVTTGVFKLRNGAEVTIENDDAPPKSKTHPTPENR